MSNTPHPDDTIIRIALPLPLHVAAALTRAIGTMWPASTIRSGMDALVVDVGRLAPKRTSQKQLRTILAEICGDGQDPEAYLERWTDTGPMIGVEAKSEAMQSLATWALIMLTSEAAPNYVEQTVQALEPDGTPREFVVTAAWSPAQTPHQRIKELEAALAKATCITEHDDDPTTPQVGHLYDIGPTGEPVPARVAALPDGTLCWLWSAHGDPATAPLATFAAARPLSDADQRPQDAS